MGTSMAIAKLNADGSARTITVHYDGYPDYAIPTLNKGYKDEAAVDALLDLGDLSSLGLTLETCGRVRGPRGATGAITVPAGACIRQQGVEEYYKTEYAYLWVNGTWICV